MASVSEQDLTDANRVEFLQSISNSSKYSLHNDIFDDDDAIELAPPSNPRLRRRSEVSRLHQDDYVIDALPVLPVVSEDVNIATVSFDKADALENLPSTPVSEYPPSSVVATAQNTLDSSSLSSSQKAYHKERTLTYFLAVVWCFFLQGWNDGSTGPLLPRIQKSYNVGFTIVSLLFVLNCVGYVTGALINVWLNERWGFGKIILMGSCIQALAYITMSSGGPFPVMVFGYCLSGFGMALQNAQANGLIISFKDAPTYLGFLHAGYGLGALVAPLVATQFAKMSSNWHLYYIISTALAASNSLVLYFIYKLRKQEELLADAGQPAREPNVLRDNVFKQIFRIPALHSLAIFAVIYVGIEVTLGGWIVTFIEEVRGAGSNAGYISSGFFGGLMVGRVALMWLNNKVGPRRVLFIYLLLAIQLEVTIWVVPSLFENAIAVSLIGCLLGPMYPIMVNHSTKVLPNWLLTPSVGWIAGAGQTGSALLPFLTGLLSSKFGIKSLQPFVVSMMSALLILWAMVPRAQPRVD